MPTVKSPLPQDALRVAPGELMVGPASSRAIVSRALGSAMALSVFDPEARVGGVLLFMYPDSKIKQPAAPLSAAYFADTGIPALVRAVCAAGASRERLVCRLAGGSGVLDPEATFNVCRANRAAALKALEDLGLTLTAERLGGSDALGMSFDLSRGTMTLTMPRGQELEVL